VRSTTYA
jgi:large subunit ribosomal protein L26e